MNISSNKFGSIELMREKLKTNPKQGTYTGQIAAGTSFDEILANTRRISSGELKFSKHASERLSSRQISLTEEQMMKLESGTKLAKSKGITESLVVVDGLKFIVSVKNNTVITAVSDEEEQVFTNIDGAVIM